jgi:hypothetical protein
MQSRFAPKTKHPIEDVEYFAKHPEFQQQLKRSDDPAKNRLYRELRADWKLTGQVGENGTELGERVRREWAQSERPRSYTQNELAATGKYSEAVVREVKVGNYLNVPFKSISDLARDDYAEYCRFELAAASYNIGGRSAPEAEARYVEASRIPEPVNVPTKHKVTKSMATDLNLVEGSELDDDSFYAAVKAQSQVREEREAERVRSLAKAHIEAEQNGESK